MGSVMVIALDEPSPLGTQVQHMPFHRRGLQDHFRPFAQTTQALSKLPFRLRTVGRPDFVAELAKSRLHLLRGPVTDLDKGVQKTQNYRHLGKEPPPGLLRRFPAISIDRLGLVVGLECLGFSGKDPVGPPKALGSRPGD